MEAAQRAVGLADAEHGSYAAQNLPELLLERSPDARAAADAVEQAVADLVQAKVKWDAIQADAIALLRLAGASTAGLPSFPNRLADLVRDARRVGGIGCPPPIDAPTASVSEAA